MVVRAVIAVGRQRGIRAMAGGLKGRLMQMRRETEDVGIRDDGIEQQDKDCRADDNPGPNPNRPPRQQRCCPISHGPC
jgi:hypothetical protein